MTGVHLYLRLLQYVRPYWWAFGLAVLGMAVVAGGDLVMAMLVIPIVNNFQNPDPAKTQWLPLGGHRGVPAARPGIVRLRVRHGLHGASRRLRPALRAGRQAAAAAHRRTTT